MQSKFCCDTIVQNIRTHIYIHLALIYVRKYDILLKVGAIMDYAGLEAHLRYLWDQISKHPKRSMPYIIEDINALNYRQNENFKVSAHGKYEAVPEHRHEYLEMMFVYNGSITHVIDGNDVVLNKGDFCILDTRTVHEIKKSGEEDEAVNFVMDKSFFSSEFLSRLSGNKLFSGFIANALYKNGSKKHLVIATKDDKKVRDYSLNIMCEYFDPDPFCSDAIENLLLLLFNELMRIWKRQNGQDILDDPGNTPNFRAILRYIETNYSTVTLKSAASRFGYSPKYFSKMLSEELGQSFTDIKHDICMKQAAFLLSNSELSISDVASSVGFVNYSFFYSLFKKKFGMTPAKFREINAEVVKGTEV